MKASKLVSVVILVSAGVAIASPILDARPVPPDGRLTSDEAKDAIELQEFLKGIKVDFENVVEAKAEELFEARKGDAVEVEKRDGKIDFDPFNQHRKVDYSRFDDEQIPTKPFSQLPDYMKAYMDKRLRDSKNTIDAKGQLDLEKKKLQYDQRIAHEFKKEEEEEEELAPRGLEREELHPYAREMDFGVERPVKQYEDGEYELAVQAEELKQKKAEKVEIEEDDEVIDKERRKLEHMYYWGWPEDKIPKRPQLKDDDGKPIEPKTLEEKYDKITDRPPALFALER